MSDKDPSIDVDDLLEASALDNSSAKMQQDQGRLSMFDKGDVDSADAVGDGKTAENKTPVDKTEPSKRLDSEEDGDRTLARISDLQRNFRDNDARKRLRTEALIQIYEGRAKAAYGKDASKQAEWAAEIAQSNDSLTAKAGKGAKVTQKKKLKKVLDPVHAHFWARRTQEVIREMNFDIKSTLVAEKERRKAYQQQETVEESCIPIINDMSKVKLVWDMFILFLAVVTSFAVGFELVLQGLPVSVTYKVFSFTADALFAFDICVQFRTTFFSVEGEEVRDYKQIGMKYLRGTFLIDLIATIPWSLTSIQTLKLLKIFKVTRITRFTKVIQKLELKEDQKAIVKIFKLILTLLLIMHIIGCIWFIVVSVERKWVPPLDFIYVQRGSYYRFYDLEEVTDWYQYMVVLYMAVLALGGNEMGPRTTLEIIYIFVVLIGLILYNAVIFGEMTVLVGEVSKKESDFQQQVDVANTAMKNMDLPKDAQNDVRLYLITTQGTQYEQKQLNSFLGIISPSLNQKVSVEIFTGTVKKNLQLKTAIMSIARGSVGSQREMALKEEELIKPIVQRMEAQLNEPDAEIISQYNEGNAIYLISKGECLVIVSEESSYNSRGGFSSSAKSKKGKEDKGEEKLLRPGYLFGEISIVYNCLTTATVMAKKYCNLGKLTKKNYKEIITMQPKIQDEIKTGIYEYDDKMLKFIKKSMQKVPYFQHLASDDPILYDIIYTLDTKTMIKGAELQKAGSDADELYFLQSGMIEVYTNFEKKEFVIERLFKGSIVNYRTFFMEERGSVNLRFANPSVLKVLSKEQMNKIVEKHPSLGQVFNKYQLSIMKKNKSIPLDYVMALPVKINNQLMKDTRKKLLQGDQDDIQNRLDHMRQQYAKEKGLEMPDDQLRRVTQQIKQDIVPDDKVKTYRAKTNLLENKLKNIVIRQIVRIREERNKQTIKEAVDAILLQNRAQKDKRSKKVEKHVKKTFEQNAATAMEDNQDILYNRIIVNMKRLLKVLTGHSTAIDSLERKLREISKPKKKKKAMQNVINNLHEATNSGSLMSPGYDQNQLLDVDDLDGDNEGMDDLFQDQDQPEYQDEIDQLSEGAVEREIMMDRIQMVEVDQMEQYKKYTLKLDKTANLKINDSDDLSQVSSEDSREIPDKEEADEQ